MAKNFKKSDYAKNKFSEGIVYTFVDGSEVEISFSAIIEENPNLTQEKFEELKKVSDEIFKIDEQGNDVYSKHVKTTYEEIDGGSWLATKSFEDTYFDEQDDMHKVASLLKFIESELTDTQKRRLKLFMSGMSGVNIAKLEGKSQHVVWKSINQAQNKIIKFLEKFSK